MPKIPTSNTGNKFMYSSSALALPSSQLDHQITVPYSGEPLTFIDEKIMSSGVNPTTEVQISRKLSKRLNVLILVTQQISKDALPARCGIPVSLSGVVERDFTVVADIRQFSADIVAGQRKADWLIASIWAVHRTLEQGTADCLDLRNPPAPIAKGASASYQDEANDK
ncbi:hypothetical protein CISG_09970 [Coccidioides immitis RMSCC 3703]|uniref:Uncharacterized protein n=1 Tax=Coccidioides immitis RMSCC 3703 TaxID=454286 RepID=A0A0J8QKJ7_COCIT|nr:hypothetical protein CISG_09970 [Coccidioides immitis RMSCC 3703]